MQIMIRVVDDEGEDHFTSRPLDLPRDSYDIIVDRLSRQSGWREMVANPEAANTPGEPPWIPNPMSENDRQHLACKATLEGMLQIVWSREQDMQSQVATAKFQAANRSLIGTLSIAGETLRIEGG